METTEIQKDFRGWCEKKILLDALPNEKIVYFRRKEIWWCALGVNIGFEQDGKNHNYERPVLILKKVNRHLALVVPLSTKTKNHPYYVCYKRGEDDYSALVLQIRIVSSKRFLRRLGSLETETYQMIVSATKDFVGKKK
jgi:mRNA interferase MazF